MAVGIDTQGFPDYYRPIHGQHADLETEKTRTIDTIMASDIGIRHNEKKRSRSRPTYCSAP